MAASKSGFMKDALILFAITLVSGLCLEAATIAANNANLQTGPSGGRELR